MDVIFRIINFVVLFGALGFLARNIIKKMFQSRIDKVNSDLDEADAANKKAGSLAVFFSNFRKQTDYEKSDIWLEAKARIQVDNKELEIAGQTEAENKIKRASEGEDGLRANMQKQVESEGIAKVAELTREVLAQVDFEDSKEKLNENFINKIRELLKAMPSDIVNMNDLKKLNITISSANPPTEEEMAKIKELVSDAFITYNTDTNSALLGGLKMQVGDTVYDGTLEHQLDLLKTDIENRAKEHTVTENIKERIENAGSDIDVFQTGKIISLGDGICRISGLSDCMAGEMLEFPGGLKGMVQDLDTNNVGAVLMGNYEHIEEGDIVKRTEKILEVPVGNAMIGRVVNAVGEPIDGAGDIITNEFRAVESPAPTIVERKSVSVPLQTGIKAIDALIPIGRGQRELIIGDRQTGKTAIAIDTILNQKGKDVICVYCAIGQKESTVASVVEKLKKSGSMDYTVVVSASASEPAPMLYIAPYSATSIAEYFMYNGKDVLIIYDDLTKQAVAYRELSLLLQRPPGREAYPGDVFYLHSRLLERSARLSDEFGGGSLTALPIIETQAGDISAYIPTNVISITDGQIFLETDLFHSGVRPAINVGLSVSRVGGAAQVGSMKQIAGRLRMDLAQFRELESFSRFGSDLDKATLATINRGQHMTEILKQGQYVPMDVADQVVIIYAGNEGYLDDIPLENVKRFEEGLLKEFDYKHPDIKKSLQTGNKMSEDDRVNIRMMIESFAKHFK